MFKVYDNGKPATSATFSLMEGIGWDNCEFHTFNEAVAYVENWLGTLGNVSEWKVNTPVDYTGYGDMIEIKEEK